MNYKNPRTTPYQLTIQEMQEIAKEKGGECLSPVYANSRIKLKWKCKAGHIWEATSNNIKRYWCPFCAVENRKGIEPHKGSRKKLSFSDCQKLAVEKEGKLLSTEYINNVTKMIWQCKAGHQFKMDIAHVKRGQWCGICAMREKTGKSLNLKKEIKKIEKHSPEKVIIEIKNFEYKHIKFDSELMKEIKIRAKEKNISDEEYILKALNDYIRVVDILSN